MKVLLLIVFLSGAVIGGAQTLRLSEVSKVAGEDTEEMVHKTEDGEERFFVKKEAVISDPDVKHAAPSNLADGQIDVILTEEGAKKLKRSTEKMHHGRDRLAIIVEGKLVSAPVVMSALGGNFVITGMHDLGKDELLKLARKISGVPAEDLQKAAEKKAKAEQKP